MKLTNFLLRTKKIAQNFIKFLLSMKFRNIYLRKLTLINKSQKFDNLIHKMISNKNIELKDISFTYLVKFRLRKYILKVLTNNLEIYEFKNIIFLKKIKTNKILNLVSFFLRIGRIDLAYSMYSIIDRNSIDKFLYKEFPNIKKYRTNKANYLFTKAIHSKKVFIIGPKAEKNVYSKTDEFDTVIEINTLENQFENKNISRIVYFNFEFLSENYSYISKTTNSNEIFAVKNRDDVTLLSSLKNVKTINYNYRQDYYGQLNMLPLIINDIISEKPEKIDIIGFDLYSSINIYNEKYKKNYDRSKIFNSFAVHNPFIQFDLLKFLLSESKINIGDKKFHQLLKKGIDSYAKKLHISHSINKRRL